MLSEEQRGTENKKGGQPTANPKSKVVGGATRQPATVIAGASSV